MNVTSEGHGTDEPTIRQQIRQLQGLGPLPRENSPSATQALLDQYRLLLEGIVKPVSDPEARVLVRLFGPGGDTCYGLAWGLLHLIESAPGWPLIDVVDDRTNGWIQFLRDRAVRAGLLTP